MPNVAARLSDVASDDEILVSATTLGGENYFFTTRERGELQLQGKVKPVSVLEVLGHSSVSNRYEARTKTGLTPFVGRVDQLSVLDRELREIIAGASRDVAIVGSAGMEKPAWSKSFCSARLFFHRRFAGVIARTTSPPSRSSRFCRCSDS